ncbi:hypothetical protein [Brevibacillus sp. 179-C9.3 HS]
MVTWGIFHMHLMLISIHPIAGWILIRTPIQVPLGNGLSPFCPVKMEETK